MARTRLYRDGVLALEGFPAEDLSAYAGQPDCTVWLDLCDPTEADFDLITEQFGLHEPAVSYWDDSADLAKEGVGFLLHGLLDYLVDDHFRPDAHPLRRPLPRLQAARLDLSRGPEGLSPAAGAAAGEPGGAGGSPRPGSVRL
ncbi:hypothetical protein ACIA8F_28930 [Streptomyces sp. NPDC051563]|uniref:hypothetical protein n=1 Tax=Streptomyces sp. NPDC051563 TaxID=3365659 RepID=UPI0037A5B700